MSPTDFGSAKLTSMHDESFFAKLAVFDGQPRFTVVLPKDCLDFLFNCWKCFGYDNFLVHIY